MLHRMLGKDYDRRRLRALLALLFIALAAPTGVMIGQAYSRLKWEAFHQHRGQAEELVGRIDAEISERIGDAEARSFADYSFLNVAGDPEAGFLQRSSLSAYPVVQDLPGIIGYFQVDADGMFSTPLLPATGADPAALGISADEYRARRALTEQIRGILADNRLVVDRVAPTGPARRQQFDRLNEQEGEELRQSADSDAKEAATVTGAEPGRMSYYGKVQQLQLDDALQRKSEGLEEAPENVPALRPQERDIALTAERSRRVEKAALLEAAPSAPGVAGARAEAEDLRITTFESEVDPYEFSLLDSGHFVLFRKVWREGERYIQGFLIEPAGFLDAAIESAFRATTLAGMADLVVAYGDDVIRLSQAAGQESYAASAPEMEGALLYRSRLSAPLDALELIFSLRRLPPGPGAVVLAWTTFLLAVVFLGGFYAIYRLGLGQIRLARQQQDFVSAVSHELKTPLTSIRMYGEMLREGWADEAKRKQYYEYIHDESERLTRLISNVLQLASITRNEPSFDLQPLTTGELLDHMRSKISNQVERAGFELEFEVDEESRDAELLIDEDCFAQIVINLVDNAIKFSRNAETRKIHIAARAASDSRVRFSVRDYGPGIPRDQIKKIFRLFYRTESELTRETVGTGIGLAIVHHLSTAMNGTVDVINRNPGAEFGVSFRISKNS